MRTIYTFILFLILPVCALSQQSKYTISGRVADAQNAPIAYASVAVYVDAKPIVGTITDDKAQNVGLEVGN